MRKVLTTGLVSVLLLTCTAWAKKQDASAEAGKDIQTVSKAIPFETKYQFSRDVAPGRIQTYSAGKPGKKILTYRVTRKDGKVLSKKLIATETVEPQAEIILMGKKGYTSRHSSFGRGKILTMTATAYHPMAGEGQKWGGRTKLGVMAKYGVVAVDPRVIPLGTFVYVEGYGFAYAADTGSAIKGNKIDLCMPTNAQCNAFGRRKVRVHVLSTR